MLGMPDRVCRVSIAIPIGVVTIWETTWAVF